MKTQRFPSINDNGFTLIELVMVIVILGILSATALPRFVNMSDDSRTATLAGVIGGITSASSTNQATRKLNATYGVAINNCSQVGTLLQGGTLPAGFSVAAQAIAADTTVQCVVTDAKGNTGNASVVGIN